MYFPIGLEARILESRNWQCYIPSEASENDHSLSSAASASCLNLLHSLQSLPLLSQGIISVSLSSPVLIRISVTSDQG